MARCSRARGEIVARAGDVVTVEPRVAHQFRNVGEEEVRFLTEDCRALSFEEFLETMFGLAADGKTDAKGRPNPFRLAVIRRNGPSPTQTTRWSK